MFGYIRPLKPELKIKDYEAYRSVYCGLCKSLGRFFGPFARLTLNYDFTFLALLSMGLSDKPVCASKQRCIMHPFNKRLCCQNNEQLQLTACAAMLMVYYKNEDNYNDGNILDKTVSLLLRPLTAFARRRAKRLYPNLDELLCDMMKRQTSLERQGCRNIDDAADPTASALSSICTMLSNNEREQRVLSRFGYLLGRWVYLIDALDDLEDDYKHKNYNPFLESSDTAPLSDDSFAAIKEQAVASLRLTHGEMTKAYQLLTLYQYGNILENIVFLGLPAALARVCDRIDKSQG